MSNDEFLTFAASNRWLEKWKISYGIREKRVNGEAGEVSGETVNLWIERLWELTLLAPISQNGQTHSNNASNCLSVFDHFVGLALKRLTKDYDPVDIWKIDET